MSATTQRERPVWTWTCEVCEASGQARTERGAAHDLWRHHVAHHSEATQAS